MKKAVVSSVFLIAVSPWLALASDNDNSTTFLQSYHLEFIECQALNTFQDSLAAEPLTGTMLGTERFAIFRLCPSATECQYNYGEYLLDLETYLEITVQHFVQQEQLTE